MDGKVIFQSIMTVTVLMYSITSPDMNLILIYYFDVLLTSEGVDLLKN